MANTRLRIQKQLQQSTLPGAVMVTTTSGEPTYLDPTVGADRIPFYDDSASALTWLTLGTGLSISGTTINATGASITDGAGLLFAGSTLNVGTASSSRIVVNADNIDLATTAATPGSYGIDPGTHPAISVDAYGRIISVAELVTEIDHGDVLDWTEAVQDTVGAFLVAGTGISITYNDPSNTLTIASSLATTEAFVEGSTASSIDLDANIGVVKDVNGNNIAFTTPADLKTLEIYKNGQRLNMTGSLTTRDYSIGGGHVLTLSTALLITDVLYITKTQ